MSSYEKFQANHDTTGLRSNQTMFAMLRPSLVNGNRGHLYFHRLQTSDSLKCCAAAMTQKKKCTMRRRGFSLTVKPTNPASHFVNRKEQKIQSRPWNNYI